MYTDFAGIQHELYVNFTILINVVSQYSVFFRNPKQRNPRPILFIKKLQSSKPKANYVWLWFSLLTLPWKYAYWLSLLLYLPPIEFQCLFFMLWRFSNFFQHLYSLRLRAFTVLFDMVQPLIYFPYSIGSNAYWLSLLLYLPPSQRPSNACFAVTEVLEWSTKSYWYRIQVHSTEYRYVVRYITQ